MAETGFSGDGFTLLAEKLRLFTTEFAAEMHPATEMLAQDMRTEVNALYGNKLGHYWNFDIGSGGESAATLTVWTEDPKVYGYEYGTKRHRIPKSGNAKPALHFDWKDGQVWFASLEHPGTKPHTRRFELKDKLASAAQARWSEALAAAFNGLL